MPANQPTHGSEGDICPRCKAWDDLIDGDVPIRKFLMENGVVSVEMDAEHWAVKLLVKALSLSLLDTLDSTGAPNYTESKCEVALKPAGTVHPVIVTVQRPGKRTPHELRRAAEAENEQLRAALRDLVDSPEQGSIGSIGNVRRTQWVYADKWEQYQRLAHSATPEATA